MRARLTTAAIAAAVLALGQPLAIQAAPLTSGTSGTPAPGASGTQPSGASGTGTGTPDPLGTQAPGASGTADAAADEANGAELTLLATTDMHGHVLNWDYFADAPYPAGKELGAARASTLVSGVRQEKGAERVVLVDNGDTIQGTPLAYYYAKQEPITTTGATHPMARVLNTMDYDAQVLGNHEFNYGLDLLGAYEGQLDAELLGANAIDESTGKPLTSPYTLVERTIDGQPVTVGILGVTTPGSRIWDKGNLDGRVRFTDPAEATAEYVPQMQAAGADVVVVLSHSGKDPAGQDRDPQRLDENVSTSVAEVPGVDVVVVGHTHQDEPSEIVTRDDGTKALMTQPNYWARSVSQVDIPLKADDDGEGLAVDWSGTGPVAEALRTQGDVAEDPAIVDGVAEAHRKTVDYVNTTIGRTTEEMSAARSRYEDTAILDFISMVQQQKVKEALAGTPEADLPVISQASPFSREAVFPQGDITIRDVAGLYVYDNTLAGVKITGQQLKEYLEYSARYFRQTEEGAAFDPETGTNAPGADGRDIPDYNYDALTGVSYDINVSKPAGSRIEHLAMPDGSPVADDAEFVMAINNYRQSGGGGYPVADLPEVYNEQVEIRQALIDWTQEHEVIDPQTFFEANWQLVTKTREKPTEEPTGEPTQEPTGGPTSTEGPGEGDSDGDGDGSGRDDRAGDRGSDGTRLPRTGAEVLGALGAAAAVLAAGGAMIAASRRRGSRD